MTIPPYLELDLSAITKGASFSGKEIAILKYLIWNAVKRGETIQNAATEAMLTLSSIS